MKRATVVAELERCVKRGSNDWWHGMRGLRALPAGVDRRLVERAMRVVFQRHVFATCTKLSDEYVPIAWRVLVKMKEPFATFLVAYAGDDDGQRLRDACTWLDASTHLDPKSKDRHVVALCANAVAVAAAQATVVRHGIALRQLIAVLAHDASDASIDALVEVVEHARTARDASLDQLVEWLTPFARGPRMRAVLATVDEALRARATDSPVRSLIGRFGGKGDRLAFTYSISSKQVRYGAVRKAHAHVALQTHALPNVIASVTWNTLNFKWSRWEDGVVTSDELKLRGPKSIDDIPRWIAAGAKALRVTWDPTTIRVKTSLRGKARAAATAWLVG